MKHVTDVVTEIRAASRQQSEGIGQVTQAVTQMDEVTQQNAALVEQAAAASQALQEQAVSVFKLDLSEHGVTPVLGVPSVPTPTINVTPMPTAISRDMHSQETDTRPGNRKLTLVANEADA